MVGIKLATVKVGFSSNVAIIFEGKTEWSENVSARFYDSDLR